MRRPKRWLLLLSFVAPVRPCPAQDSARVHLAVEVGLAGWQGLGGLYRDRGTAGFAALTTLRFGRGTRAWVMGIGTTRQFAFGHDAVCAPAPGGGCLEWYPHISNVVALAGGEGTIGARGPGLRALAGIGWYATRPQAQRLRRVWGLPVRVQATSPALGRLRLAVSGRADVLQRVRGERLRQVGYELGVRVQ